MVGRAAEYDLRRALVPITDESWDSAVRAEGLPRPALPGQLRFFTFCGLEPGTSYYLALRSSDGVPNWSALSNVVGRATLSIGTRQLTMSGQPGGAGQPHWSPDGQTILTCADWEGPRGHDQIYLVPAAGGDPVQLTHVPRSVKIRDACWSPDGTQIAFIADPSGYCEIHVMRAMPDAASYPVTHLESPNLANCVWSLDGSRIAYLDVASSDPAVVWRICIVPADGGSASVLRGANVGSCIAPAWSPDGTRIAFSSDRTGDHEIYVVSAEGGEPARLTDDPANDTRPAWSPDGDQIAFSSDRTGNSDLWLMSSEGRYPTPITFDPAGEGRPSWAPDGHNIAFLRYASDGISDIWVLEGEESAR